MTFVEKIKYKMNEYGLKIFTDYPSKERCNEHIFYVEEMILFASTKEENLAVSFQATIKPDKAANLALILSEINRDVDVMESFIFNANNECILGDKAFKLIEKTKIEKISNELIQNQFYTQMLLNSDNAYKC